MLCIVTDVAHVEQINKNKMSNYFMFCFSPEVILVLV